MGQPDLNRRQLLGGLGGLAVAGSLGFAAVGTGADALASGAGTRVRYWNLFSGGDGANMIAMLDAFRKANPGIDVKDSTLRWGNPYYTKLAMAAAGDRAPELGVTHLGRLAGFAPERLLDPFDREILARYGVREEDFDPALWKRSVIDGKLYALPLDIHPQLNFYRKDVCEKAGLIGDDGNLVPLTSTDDWFDALKAAKKAVRRGIQTVGVHASDQNFAWWFFMSFYAQAGGTYYDSGLTDVTFDTDKATEVLEFLRRHITDGYNVPGAPDAEHFINGGAFVWEGGWSVPVYSGPKLDYGATPLPALFGKPATQAESHAFVLPRQAERGGAGNEAAHRLAAHIVLHAVDWAGGGHIPAHLPTLSDPAYQKLRPQSEYASAMDHMALEPEAWFSGSSGTLSQRIGPVVVAANLGSVKPEAVARRMRRVLEGLLEMRNPMGGGAA
ncbi:extracellular solute-binding protein [Streptomyces sporangiiformans]|uniref:Extracellular solute-binding protein n=1 Tax=Streptomyces sporangiiformans TaxID=2315329 RepID=A0A505DFD0_9ACTN|nr:extracellular solute-binding protein [Streptomyces sporangiiformans]TPQ15451.1 extracellular solute-binding protein [Streptomyces sporangiiformans]